MNKNTGKKNKNNNNGMRGDYNFTTVVAEGVGGSQAVLSTLRPFTKYFIVIQAFNSQGTGPLSTPISATTLEDS